MKKLNTCLHKQYSATGHKACFKKKTFAFRLMKPGFVRRKQLLLPRVAARAWGILADSLKCNPAFTLRSSLQGSKPVTTFIVVIIKATASLYRGQAAAHCTRGDVWWRFLIAWKQSDLWRHPFSSYSEARKIEYEIFASPPLITFLFTPNQNCTRFSIPCSFHLNFIFLINELHQKRSTRSCFTSGRKWITNLAVGSDETV